MRTPPAVLLSCVLAASLSGCGSQPVENHTYLLRAQASEPGGEGAVVIRLARVQVAPYLDQQGIVLELESSEIQVARHNRWSEPLDHAVQRYLQVAISARADLAVEVAPLNLGAEAAVLEVSVHQLHGSRGGLVRLVAEWTARTAGAAPRSLHREFTASSRIDSDGFEALVAQHKVLLDALAAEMAAGLEQLLGMVPEADACRQPLSR